MKLLEAVPRPGLACLVCSPTLPFVASPCFIRSLSFYVSSTTHCLLEALPHCASLCAFVLTISTRTAHISLAAKSCSLAGNTSLLSAYQGNFPIHPLITIDDGVSSPACPIRLIDQRSCHQNVHSQTRIHLPTPPLPVSRKGRRGRCPRQHPRGLQYLFNPPLFSSITSTIRATFIIIIFIYYS